MKIDIQILIKPLLLVALIIMAMPLKSQNPEHGNNSKNLEISTGYSYLIYQSGYGFKSSQGMEVLVSRRLDDTYKVETGFRVTLNPGFPEVFVRGNIGHHFNRWQPLFGLETGITKRADFESSSNLLKETREAMLKDVGLMYLSAHIELLSFNLKRSFNISFLEVDMGTHYKHFGRTLRAQTTLIRIRKTF